MIENNHMVIKMKIKISKVDEKAKDNTDNRQNTKFKKKKNNLNLQLR